MNTRSLKFQLAVAAISLVALPSCRNERPSLFPAEDAAEPEDLSVEDVAEPPCGPGWSATGDDYIGVCLAEEPAGALAAAGFRVDEPTVEHVDVWSSGFSVEGEGISPAWAMRLADVVSSYGRFVVDAGEVVYARSESRVVAVARDGTVNWEIPGHLRYLGPALDSGVVFSVDEGEGSFAAMLNPAGEVGWVIRTEAPLAPFARACSDSLIAAFELLEGRRRYFLLDATTGEVTSWADAWGSKSFHTYFGGWATDGESVVAVVPEGVSLVDLNTGVESTFELDVFNSGRMPGAWPLPDSDGWIIRWTDHLYRVSNGQFSSLGEISGLPDGAIIQMSALARDGGIYLKTTGGIYLIPEYGSGEAPHASIVAGILGVPGSPPIDLDDGRILVVEPHSLRLTNSPEETGDWQIAVHGWQWADPPAATESGDLVVFSENGVLARWESQSPLRPIADFAQYQGGASRPGGRWPPSNCP